MSVLGNPSFPPDSSDEETTDDNPLFQPSEPTGDNPLFQPREPTGDNPLYQPREPSGDDPLYQSQSDAGTGGGGEGESGGGSSGDGGNYVDPASVWSDVGPKGSEGESGGGSSGGEGESGGGSSGNGGNYVDPASGWSDVGPRGSGSGHDFVTELPNGSFRVHYPWLGGASDGVNALVDVVEQWGENCLGLIGIKDSYRITEDLRDLEYFLKKRDLPHPEDVGVSEALERYRDNADLLTRIESNLEYRDTGVEHISTEDLPKKLRSARRRVENTLNDLGETLEVAADEGLGKIGDGEFNRMTPKREGEILGSLFHAVDEIAIEIRKASEDAKEAALGINRQSPGGNDGDDSDTGDDSPTDPVTAAEKAAAAAEEAAVAAEEAAAAAEEALAAASEASTTPPEEVVAAAAEQAAASAAQKAVAAILEAQQPEGQGSSASGTGEGSAGDDSSNADGSGADEESSSSGSEPDQDDEGDADMPSGTPVPQGGTGGGLEMVPMLAMTALSALVSAIQPVLADLMNPTDQQNNDADPTAKETPPPEPSPQPVPPPDAPPPADAAAAGQPESPPPSAAMSWGTVDMKLPDGSTQKVSPAVSEAVNKELNNPNGSDARAAYTGTSAGPWTAVDTANVRTGDVFQWAEINNSNGQDDTTVQTDHTALVVDTNAGRQIVVNGRFVPLDTNNPPIEGEGWRSEFRGFFRPSGAGIEVDGGPVPAAAAAV